MAISFPEVVPLVADSPSPDVQQLLAVDAPFVPFYTQYGCLHAPCGRPIHIVANPEITLAQIEHVCWVLQQLLKEIPGARFGSLAAKNAVADAVSEGNKVIFLQGDLIEDGGVHEKQHLKNCEDFVDGDCGLTASQIVVPGTPEYDRGDKDTTWEEVLHFVHQHGIMKALPDLQAMIDEACKQATLSGVYYPAEEHSVCSNEEYLAVALESWYGIGSCRHPADADPGFRHAGYEYPTFDSQEEQMAADPLVVDVFKAFFPEGPTRPPCSCGSRGSHPPNWRPDVALTRIEPVRQRWIEKYASLPEDPHARVLMLSQESSSSSSSGSSR
jgi:hypothetical protein